MNKVFIALGSNIDDPIVQIEQAVKKLAVFSNFRISSLYMSKPYGVTDQPDFYNACAYFETKMTAYELLDFLKNIEKEQGRVTTRRWGERCLDLDILLFNQEIISSDHLTIPHKDMQNRIFVILPLLELDPNLKLLSKNGDFDYKIKDCALQFDSNELEVIKVLK